MRSRESRNYLNMLFLLSYCILAASVFPAEAIDSETTRRTLSGLPGLYVICEELQPNIMKYDKYLLKAGLSKVQLQKDVETRLRAAGIKILSADEWLKTPGRPAVYVSVNTHENEKYWFSYDIKLELRQVVSLDARPEIKTMAPTWSLNMTGEVNIGTFKLIRDSVEELGRRFIQAYKIANGQMATGK